MKQEVKSGGQSNQRAQIFVEGYGRRFYKGDYIKFTIYALASNDETIDHLENLYETKSLSDKDLYGNLHKNLTLLGKKLNNFLRAIQNNHKKPYSYITK